MNFTRPTYRTGETLYCEECAKDLPCRTRKISDFADAPACPCGNTYSDKTPLPANRILNP